MNRNKTTDSLHWLNKQISDSWNANVRTRAEDLEQGTDSSYIHTIKPWVLNEVIQCTTPESQILDVGCGCGYLSNAIYMSGRSHIQGIDISNESVDYARKKYPIIPFHCKDVCNFVSADQFDLNLAIMTLNNLPNMNDFFSSAHSLLSNVGRMILVIPHPCYWPQRHIVNQGYSYSQEKPYEYLFSTKGRNDYTSSVLYFHRTLESYFHNIIIYGFQVTKLKELWEGPDRPYPDILGVVLDVV